MILICIVCVFLFSNIPRVILNFDEFLKVEKNAKWVKTLEAGKLFLFVIFREEMVGEKPGPAAWELCLSSVNNLCLVINASTNFIIYYIRGNAFKKAFIKCVKKLPW